MTTEKPTRRSSRAGRALSSVFSQPLAAASAIYLLVLVLSTVLAAFIPSGSLNEIELSRRSWAPLSGDDGVLHLLGTDPLGRDVLYRIIIGARISLAAGLGAVAVSGTFGVLMGLIAGFRGGRVEQIIMRLVDVQMSLPSLLIALFALYVLGSSFLNVVLVLAVTRWTVYARLTRGMVLSIVKEPYVEAANALGARALRLMFRHVLPNLIRPLIVVATLEIAVVLLLESSLSFLTLGVQPPDISWGLMLSDGREYMVTAWWGVVFPGLAILLTALAFNLLSVTTRRSSAESTDPSESR